MLRKIHKFVVKFLILTILVVPANRIIPHALAFDASKIVWDSYEIKVDSTASGILVSGQLVISGKFHDPTESGSPAHTFKMILSEGDHYDECISNNLNSPYWNGGQSRTIQRYNVLEKYQVDGRDVSTPSSPEYYLLVIRDEQKRAFIAEYFIYKENIAASAEFLCPQHAGESPYLGPMFGIADINNIQSVFGSFVMKLNKLESGVKIIEGSGGTITNIPQICKDIIIQPVSKNDFKDVKEMAAILNYDHSPWNDADEDVRLYKEFYASDYPNSGYYPNVHLNYTHFLDLTQDAITKVDGANIELASDLYENKLSSFTTWVTDRAGADYGTGALAAGTAYVGYKTVKTLGPFWNVATSSLPAGGVLSAGSAGLFSVVGLAAAAAAVGGVALYRNHVNNDAMAATLKVLVAQQYIQHHFAFHQCMIDQGITGQNFTQQKLDEEKSAFKVGQNMVNQLLTTMKEVNNSRTGSSCDVDFGAGPLLNSGICWAFKGLFEGIIFPLSEITINVLKSVIY